VDDLERVLSEMCEELKSGFPGSEALGAVLDGCGHIAVYKDIKDLEISHCDNIQQNPSNLGDLGFPYTVILTPKIRKEEGYLQQVCQVCVGIVCISGFRLAIDVYDGVHVFNLDDPSFGLNQVFELLEKSNRSIDVDWGKVMDAVK
jgi:hypothetical protein